MCFGIMKYFLFLVIYDCIHDEYITAKHVFTALCPLTYIRLQCGQTLCSFNMAT